MPENLKFIIDQYYCCLICVDCHLKKIQTLVLLHLWINNTPFKFNQWMQMIITFKNHTLNKYFLWYFSTIVLPYSQPIIEDTRWKVLNLGSSIKGSILWAFLSSYFLKKERKKIQNLNNFLCYIGSQTWKLINNISIFFH